MLQNKQDVLTDHGTLREHVERMQTGLGCTYFFFGIEQEHRKLIFRHLKHKNTRMLTVVCSTTLHLFTIPPVDGSIHVWIVSDSLLLPSMIHNHTTSVIHNHTRELFP